MDVMARRKLKLPPSIRIGHLDYEVRSMAEDVAEHVAGLCRNDAQIIEICESQGPGALAETILHEVLHAVFHVAKSRLRYDTEERVVNQITPVLLMAMRDNRALFASILEAIDTPRS